MNNIRNFVCAASALLAVWLGVTFVSKVPPHRYPSQGASASAFPVKDSAAVLVDGKPGLATVPTVPVAR